MPSGITHMILTKQASESLDEKYIDLQDILFEHQKYFRLGALGPDIPYSQEIEGFLSNEKEIADLFHYNQTNQIPLRALREIKKLANVFERETAFTFFMGYISHIFADGVIHPFVRDKVGNYNEGDNAKEHRILEMKIDVLLIHHISEQLELNFINIHDGMLSPLKSFDHIARIFSDLVNEVYNKDVDEEAIVDWVSDMHLLFEVAEGENNGFYSKLPLLSSYLFPMKSEILKDKESLFTLKKDQHEGANSNFVDREVHFINDCLPQFIEKLTPVLVKAYDYIFNDGEELTEDDVPAINLDTGRRLVPSAADENTRTGNNLDKEVVLWIN